MKKRPLVFIIINYNDYKTTERLLLNIKDYKSIHHIIVVDNHSTDQSYTYLKKYESKHITVYKTKENKGFSYGMNEGAKIALKLYKKCDLVFSNSDIILSSNENLEELQKVLSNKEIGVLGPVICQDHELSRGWKIPLPKKTIWTNLPIVGRKFSKKYTVYSEEHYKTDISFVDAVSGCFFLIKSEVLEQVGFFDENVFLYYEENILATKLKSTNYKIAVYNKVVIIHDHAVTINKNMNMIKKFKTLKKSQYYFEEKYNNATKRELFLMKFAARLTLITLYIRVFFSSKKH